MNRNTKDGEYDELDAGTPGEPGMPQRPAPTSSYLGMPARDRLRAALDIAVAALRAVEDLAQDPTWGDPRAGCAAAEALDRIRTLFPEIDNAQ